MMVYKFVTRLILLIAAASAACAAQALNWHRDGPDLYVSGMIQSGDDQILQAIHQEAPVERLVLVDSPGGALMTSLRMARWVQAWGLSTVAAGHCLSACSILFMAGHERQFAQSRPGQTPLVGIHGPYVRSTGQPSSEGALRMLAYFQQRMGEKYDAAVMERAVYQMHDPSGMLVVPSVADPASRPWHCPSNRTRRDLCVYWPDKDALSLGLLTTDRRSEVRIPTQWSQRAGPEMPLDPPHALAAQASLSGSGP